MHAFRLAHAGVVLTQTDHALVIDPGSFTTAEELDAAMRIAPPVVGIVITHEHADHWTLEHVSAIRNVAPQCPIMTTAATASALEAAGIGDVRIVAEGDTIDVGPFALEFYGGRHEVLHSSIPVVDNVGVHVNGTFAYGGDSLVRPPFRADVLGVPIGSPWSNIAQVMDFVLNARAARVYLTHDGMLSSAGLQLFTARVRECLTQNGGELIELPTVSAITEAGASLSELGR